MVRVRVNTQEKFASEWSFSGQRQTDLSRIIFNGTQYAGNGKGKSDVCVTSFTDSIL